MKIRAIVFELLTGKLGIWKKRKISHYNCNFLIIARSAWFCTRNESSNDFKHFGFYFIKIGPTVSELFAFEVRFLKILRYFGISSL